MVQRRAARWIKNDYGRTSSVSAMLSSLGLRRLELRRTDQRLILFYNIVNSYIAVPAELYLTKNNRANRSGHPQIFKQITTFYDSYKYSFFPDTIIRWNSLSPHLVILSPSCFSKAVGEIEHFSH